MGDKNNFEHIMPPTCQEEFAKNLIEQCEKQYKKTMEKAKYDEVWRKINGED